MFHKESPPFLLTQNTSTHKTSSISDTFLKHHVKSHWSALTLDSDLVSRDSPFLFQILKISWSYNPTHTVKKGRHAKIFSRQQNPSCCLSTNRSTAQETFSRQVQTTPDKPSQSTRWTLQLSRHSSNTWTQPISVQRQSLLPLATLINIIRNVKEINQSNQYTV